MANLKSAKKAIRKIKKRTVKNLAQRRELKKLIKDLRTHTEKGEKDRAEKLFPKVVKKIDKASKTKLIHKNTADRYKSRLAQRINNCDKKATKK